jgi:prepilin-type N-terminal cleavage/methylation domain-containing protein
MHRQDGFTLVEMLMAVALVGIMSAMAVAVTPNLIAGTRADSAAVSTLSVLDVARERAITERRNFEVRFITPNRIQLIRSEIPGPGTTVVTDVRFENDLQFLRFAGMPDTPDAFGGTGAINFGVTPAVFFTSEGTLVDSSGDPVNGTLFVGQTNDKTTARALTIFGVTGLIRTWKWSGTRWTE